MPTASTTSPRSAKTARKSAGKTTTRKNPRTRSARASAPQTGATHQAETATRDTTGVFSDYAERAVLIQVGAALIARDRFVESVNDTISSYRSTSKAQAQLRRFERRGVTARNRIEREVRKTRVRVERELRQRRREIERTVNDLEERRDAVTKTVPEFANRVQERILSFV